MPTRLFAASASALTDERLYALAYAAATDERRKKTDRLRRPEDRRLSLCAHLLLGYGLRSVGIPAVPDPLAYGEHGKPALPGEEVQFSLSHSGEWALCAVSERAVGCDVERIAGIDLRIAERFFAPAEYADIAAQPTEDLRSERFYRYWTQKESFVKCTGVGMSRPLCSFDLTAGLPGYAFAVFPDIPGYACAVCAEGDLPEKPEFPDFGALLRRPG